MVINHAQAATVGSLLGAINQVLINPAIAFLFAVALVYFFWGLIKFLANRGSSEDAVATGKQHMIWGVIGMFVMVSAFAIINFITASLDVKGIDPTKLEQTFE